MVLMIAFRQTGVVLAGLGRSLRRRRTLLARVEFVSDGGITACRYLLRSIVRLLGGCLGMCCPCRLVMLLAGGSLFEALLSHADGLLTATHGHPRVLYNAPHQLSRLMGLQAPAYVSLRDALAQNTSCCLNRIIP